MRSMENQNQAKAKVSAKARQAVKKTENLDHGLLLMLFFSCKRKKIEQKSLFVFLHLCKKRVVFM